MSKEFSLFKWLRLDRAWARWNSSDEGKPSRCKRGRESAAKLRVRPQFDMLEDRWLPSSTPSVTFTPSANPIAVGSPVALSAVVAPVAPNVGTPTGTVTFYNGGTTLGTASLSSGKATFNVSAGFAAGTPVIRAEYSGDGNFDYVSGGSGLTTLVVDNPKSFAGIFGTAADCGCLNQSGSQGKAASTLIDPSSQVSQNPILSESGVKIPDAPTRTGGLSSATTMKPVRYADGVVQIAATDLMSDAFGLPWGQTRSWTNGPGYATGSVNGVGWVVTQMPFLMQISGNTTIAEISNGMTAEYFDLNGTYSPRYFEKTTLVADGTNHLFVMTDEVGNQVTFYDFSGSWAAGRRGQFKSFTTPDGSGISVTSHDGNEHITEMQRSSGSLVESWVYTYLTSTVNAGLLSNVTLRTSANSGMSWTTVRQVDYTYYDGTQQNGNVGDLWTATVKDGSGTAIDNYYYRYYVPGEAGGYTHALQFVFALDSYSRLTTAIGSSSAATLDAQADSVVDDYATNYFEYDRNTARVTEEIAQAAGCSACAGGLGVFGYTYQTSGNAAGKNSWAMKTTETLPDGNQNVVYSNAYGQTMLTVFVQDPAGTPVQWMTFFVYDSDGRLILRAEPSAVDSSQPLTTYEAFVDLLDKQGSNYTYLDDSSGMVTTFSYYTGGSSPAATSSTAGAVPGYMREYSIQQGETGSPVVQEAWEYYVRSVTGATVYPIAKDTVYGASAQTTSFTYTYDTGTTTQPASVVATLPTVTTGQNGPNSATQIATFFDSHGRPIWTKDGDGYINYIAYDPITGAVVKTIVDVNTANTGDFSNKPSGWTTSGTGGLHLITTFQVDRFGRTTKETDPAGHVTYTVYLDTNQEVRVYPGWDATTHLPTGPVQVTRKDRARGYSESLTMSTTLSLDGSNLPTGGESIAGVQSLVRQRLNSAGQIVATDVYTKLGTFPYSTTATIGTIGVNYLTTTQGYDVRGRANRTVGPDGVIRRTVYDDLGRVSSEWIGSDDTPSGAYWDPSDHGAMSQIDDFVYDGGGVGDGNLTSVLQYPGSGAATIQTDSFYDWRNRLVATKVGEESTTEDDINRPIAYFEYDNLNHVIASEVYDGDGVSISSSSGVPNRPSSSLLRSRTVYKFDDIGQNYRIEQVGVDPSNGSLSGGTHTTDFVRDRRGNLTSTTDPAASTESFVYDGAGRQTVAIDARTYRTTTIFNGVGQPAAVQDGNGDWTSFAYDLANRLIEVRDGNGNRTTSVYDIAGRLAASVNADNKRTSFLYDLAGRLYETKDALSNRTTSVFDNYGNLKQSIDANGGIVSNAFDSRGRRGAVDDPLKHTWLTVFDNLDRTIASVDPLGNRTTFIYDLIGRQNVVQDPLGHRTTSTFNTLGQVVSVTDAATHTVETVYDSFAFVKATVEGNGARTSFTRDAVGRALTITDPDLNVTTKTYDAAGNLASETDPKSHIATFAYDKVNRLQSATDRLGRRRDMTYDGAGNLTLELWYATGGTLVNDRLTYTYDTLNRQRTAANSAGLQSMAYDAVNRVSQVDQPSGFILTFSYDNVGRRTVVADSAGGIETSTYDLAGNLTRRRQSNTSWVDFFYDAANREISTLRHSGTFSQPGSEELLPSVVGLAINTSDQALAGVQRSMVNSVLVVFDEAVSLGGTAFSMTLHSGVSINGGSGTTVGTVPTLSWSSADGGISWLITFSGSGVSAGSIASGVYDLFTDADQVTGPYGTMIADRTDTLHRFFGDINGDGDVDTTTDGDPDGDGSDQAAFNAAFNHSTGDPAYVRGFDLDLDDYVGTSDSFRFQINKNNRWTWSANTTDTVAFTAKRYDAAGNVLDIINGDAKANELTAYQYTYYDDNTVKTQKTNGVTITYTYDASHQVTVEQTTAGRTTYAYDAAGNRNSVDATGTGNDKSYTVGDGAGGTPDDNRYASDTDWTYTYDNEGNMTQKVSTSGSSETWLYAYDHRNQLVQVDQKPTGGTIGLTVKYKYDAWGNRVEKSVDADGAGAGSPVVMKFAIDGWNPMKWGVVGLENFDVWADLTSGGSLTTRYLRGDKIDQLLGRFESSGSARYWYLTDRLGSIRAVVDNSGVIKDLLDYDAYGNITSETNSAYRGRYAWTGREIEVEIDLQYNRARYYDPSIGRWISKDPLGFDAGDSNLFRYVRNSPTNWGDPSGFQSPPTIDVITKESADWIKRLKESLKADGPGFYNTALGLPGGGGFGWTGPCATFASNMELGLTIKKIPSTIHFYIVDKTKVRFKGNPVNADIHIVIEVKVTKNGKVESIFLDAGSTFGDRGNLGEKDNGVIAPGTIEMAIKNGGLRKFNPEDKDSLPPELKKVLESRGKCQ